jgi:secondary thiamine-phosphate synthase enzyme
MIIQKTISFPTRGEMHICDLTGCIEEVIHNSRISSGTAHIFCPGSTGAITTIEYEDGLLQDLPAALEIIAAKDTVYRHDERWHDGNGRSHVKASIIGPDLTVPVTNGCLNLGTWQQVVFIECDTRPRNRTVVVTVSGER